MAATVRTSSIAIRAVALFGLASCQSPPEEPPSPGKAFRVVCTACPMTMDFNPERLNIIYDDTSGVILRLTCG